jgi:hypothetical protein
MDMAPNVIEWEILEINGTSTWVSKQIDNKKKKKKVGEVVI